ncbi:hypothetical protein IMCC20628_00615 [Hoeflea sp. IMCC20628]|nr:hypothetical protein IMCC20628_00615 [Hoeflea sp. IMCC20628]
MKWVAIILSITIPASIIGFLNPEIIIYLLFTGVGIPISFLIIAAPTISLYTILSLWISVLIKAERTKKVILSVVSAISILWILPATINLLAKLSANSEYISGDFSDIARPMIATTIAVRQDVGIYPVKESKCDGFCLHALLTGAADRILMLPTTRPFADIDPEMELLSYRFEKRDSCPLINISSNSSQFSLPRKPGDSRKQPNAAEEARLRISEGQCLIEEKAKLSDADMILSRGQFHSADTRKIYSYSLTADTFSVQRITAHARNAKGEFEPVFRSTTGQYRPLFAPLIPTFVSSGQLHVKPGWLRTKKSLTARRKGVQTSDWVHFLTETLGLDLELNAGDRNQKYRALIETLLESSNPPKASDIIMIDAFFDQLDTWKKPGISIVDGNLVLRILDRPDYPPPSVLHAVTQKVINGGDRQEMSNWVAILLNNLKAGQTWSNDLPVDWGTAIRRISSGFTRIPADYMVPYYDELTEIAANPDMQRHAGEVIAKLHFFGDRAVPTLLDLVYRRLEKAENDNERRELISIYKTGLYGLCLAGETAPTALAPLMDLVQNQSFLLQDKLMVHSLIRMGADPEQLWRKFRNNQLSYENAESEENSRLRFDHMVQRTEMEHWRCPR